MATDGPTVLVVDDKTAVRRTLAAMVAYHGYKAVPAASGSIDRYLVGFGLGTVVWLASAMVDTPLRYVLWGAARARASALGHAEKPRGEEAGEAPRVHDALGPEARVGLGDARATSATAGELAEAPRRRRGVERHVVRIEELDGALEGAPSTGGVARDRGEAAAQLLGVGGGVGRALALEHANGAPRRPGGAPRNAA